MNNTQVNAYTYVFDKVDQLSTSREAWERGTLKKSNIERNALLSECLDFYLEIKDHYHKKQALRQYLDDNDIAYNEGTSLQTRIVRAVFKSDFQKKAYGYAKAIEIAADEKPVDMSFADFVTQRGGIEQLRRTQKGGKSPADVRRDNIAFAKKALVAAEPIAQSFKVTASTKKFDEGAEHNLTVGVIRIEADGSSSLVFETTSRSVINAALEQAGKEQGAKQKLADESVERKQIDVGLSQAISDAAAHATAA